MALKGNMQTKTCVLLFYLWDFDGRTPKSQFPIFLLLVFFLLALWYVHSFFLLFETPRYNILNPRITKNLEDPKQATQELIDDVQLEAEKYRMGHTKACSLPHPHLQRRQRSFACRSSLPISNIFLDQTFVMHDIVALDELEEALFLKPSPIAPPRSIRKLSCPCTPLHVVSVRCEPGRCRRDAHQPGTKLSQTHYSHSLLSYLTLPQRQDGQETSTQILTSILICFSIIIVTVVNVIIA